jgi:putative membrane protein
LTRNKKEKIMNRARLFLISLLTAGISVGTAFADNSPRSTANTGNTSENNAAPMTQETNSLVSTVSTADFIKGAAIGGKFEVMSSQLALQKSKNKSVRDFAQKMVNDHSKADKDLKATLTNNKIGIKPPTQLDRTHQELYDNLKNKTGADFDQAYINAQVGAHNEAVTLFRDYQRVGGDAALKDFASRTLPDLEKHETRIKEIQESRQQ